MGLRSWARGSGDCIGGSTPSPAKKLALGGMALGTLAGLAFITSPWWKSHSSKLNPHHAPSRDPMRRRIILSPGAVSNRVIWSRR